MKSVRPDFPSIEFFRHLLEEGDFHVLQAPVSWLGEIERPHEILGLHAGELDPVTIIDAALTKLRVIRAAGGSEVAVRRAMEAVIVQARDCLLANAFGLFADDSMAASQAAVGSSAATVEGTVHLD